MKKTGTSFVICLIILKITTQDCNDNKSTCTRIIIETLLGTNLVLYCIADHYFYLVPHICDN